MTPISDALRDRLGIDLQEISGAHVSGEVPVADDVVNRLIARRLADHPHIAALRVRGQDGDQLSAVVTTRSRLVPPIEILARVEAQPDFPQRPTLVLRWKVPSIGPLALLAAPALAFFKALPPGIRADGDRITVDLRVLLESSGQQELAGLIRQAAVRTRPGGFLLRVELRV